MISLRSVIEFTRTQDPTRPVTFVTAAAAYTDKAVSFTPLNFIVRFVTLRVTLGVLDLISM